MKQKKSVVSDDVCGWKFNDLEGFYETACGEGFCFEYGDYNENKYRYCPYCGRKLKEI